MRPFLILLVLGLSLRVAGPLCAQQADPPAAPLTPPKVELSGRAESDAIDVFHCAFDNTWDLNYDGWPDRWTRTEGPSYPRFVKMNLEDAPGATAGRALVLRLDGAQAEVATPPIRVLPNFGYVLDAVVRSKEISLSTVRLEIDLLDAEGKLLDREVGAPIDTTGPDSGEWTRVRLGTQRAIHPNVHHAVVRLSVSTGRRGDLAGEIAVSEMAFARLPSMTITTNNIYNVYHNPQDVVVTCRLSGIRERDPDITFQLLDATDREIGGVGSVRLDGKLVSEQSFKGSQIAAGFEGATDWKPNAPSHGFYRVRVRMLSSRTGELMKEDKISLAILPPLPEADRSEFGWTLDHVDWSPSSLTPARSSEQLQRLLPLAGLGWVKFPVWFGIDDSAQGDRIVRFVERLGAQGIDSVGVLSDPLPPLEGQRPKEAADLFSGDPKIWLPLWDHVMTRLSLRVRSWQLGGDGDLSLLSQPRGLEERIALIRSQLFRFGQDIRLGLNWSPTVARPASADWEFEQECAVEQATATGNAFEAEPESQELPSLVQPKPKTTTPDRKRWVFVRSSAAASGPTLSGEPKDNVERHRQNVLHLVEDMVRAKIEGADGIFLSQPFSGPDGVLDTSGAPGELLLPWRTTAELLGGAKHFGSLDLPGGSTNHLFLRRDGHVVMVVWNDQPTEETLYLGETIQLYDAWGRRSAPTEIDGEQRFAVGPTPTFVYGVHEAIARWSMGVRFEKDRVPSVFSFAHDNALLLKNTFPKEIGAVAVTMRFVVPRDPTSQATIGAPIVISPPVSELRLAPGEESKFPIQVRLSDAPFGNSPIRIDFDIDAEQRYSFSVWRSLQVGLGDIQVKVKTSIDSRGQLVVHQKLYSNEEGPRNDFKCLLYAPGHRRQRAQVFLLGPDGDEKRYTYPNGASLVGQTLKLRIEEIDGQRTLIHRFIVEPPAADVSKPVSEPTNSL